MSNYWLPSDPYCWSDNRDVLRNRLELKDPFLLEEAETAFVETRIRAGLPKGRFLVTHYRACHSWLFGDLYN
jgi:fido (protein-threonine AMPylation protein)